MIECFKCHELGHFQYECPSWERNVNYAEHDEEEELLLMAHLEEHKTNHEEVWYIDSGCSNHMTGNKNLFTTLDEGHRSSVELGNSARMMVMREGNVRISMGGHAHVIIYVFYIP